MPNPSFKVVIPDRREPLHVGYTADDVVALVAALGFDAKTAVRTLLRNGHVELADDVSNILIVRE
jgi:hypothetical protein